MKFTTWTALKELEKFLEGFLIVRRKKDLCTQAALAIRGLGIRGFDYSRTQKP